MPFLRSVKESMGSRIFLAYIIAALAIAGAIWYTFSTQCALPPLGRMQAMPRTDALAIWHSCIDRVGGKEAYEIFARTVAPLNADDQHRMAHVFARALYERLGTQSLTLCDGRFDYACFHEMMAGAISSRGSGEAEALLSACKAGTTDITLAWACEHGVGHGLVVAHGYTEDSLREALEVCKSARPDRLLASCYNGVFMEYNQRSFGSGEPREFTGDFVDVCARIPKDFIPACFYRLPKWWRYTVFKTMSTTTLFSRVGELCMNYTDDPLSRDGCFSGVGRLAAVESGEKAEEAPALCFQASTDERDRFNCTALAANAIAQAAPSEDTDSMCEDFSDEYRAKCLDWAHLPESLQDTDRPAYMSDSL